MNLIDFDKAAECLRLVANPQRLKIICLMRTERLTVGEIAARVGLLQHVTSEHLRLMQRCGFLRSTREGRSVFYEIAEPHLYELLECIEGRFTKRSSDGTDIPTTAKKPTRSASGTSTRRRKKSG